ncbi:MAG: SpoIIE family protein phosphatase [Bacteroidetes bacterium]|nr:SpoIIE family protein phosphatase [Bacteroidota bacterium]
MKKEILLLAFLFLFISFIHSGNLDSLRIKLGKAKNDSARVDLLYKAAGSKKNSQALTDSLLNEIIAYKNNKDCYVRAFCFYKVGSYYAQRESPQKALDNLLIALKAADSCRSPRAIMLVRNRIAYVNKINENFPVAIKNSHISLSYARTLKDSVLMAENFTLLGNMYKTMLLIDSALFYHYQALAIRERLKDEAMIALTYNNLGLAYKNKMEYDKALNFLRKSLALKIKIKDNTIASSYNNLSIVFKHLGLFDSAIYYSQKVLDESIKYKQAKVFREGFSGMAEAYDAKKDFAKAVYYYKRLKVVEDSIGKETITNQYQELQSRYESDKKDSELKLKEDSLKLADAQNSRKNMLIVFSCIALLMAVIAAFVIFRSYRQSKEVAEQLGFKNKLIEEKNKEITDSINYAKNIQQNLLTSDQLFKDNLKDHFILYLPKDIVSGDFYWAENIENEFIVMCADCTGHGVPGAFMSLLGISYLKEITFHQKIHRPDLVLNELRKRLIESFKRNSSKDGMDASLVKIKDYRLEMAAANNPVWVIRDKLPIVLKPDKFPIGKHYGEFTGFTLTTFELKPGDLVLMYTDGYADQFGGKQNKKYKYKRLQELIINNSALPLGELKTILESDISQWKGKQEQVDDILIIGIRI